MLYQKSLLIPANTLETSPVETTIQLVKGSISKIEVAFPPGCLTLAHAQILHKGSLVWPSSPGESFAWDNYTYIWNDDFPLDEEPYQLRLSGWNTDTLYPHTVTVRFQMLSSAKDVADYMRLVFGVRQVE